MLAEDGQPANHDMKAHEESSRNDHFFLTAGVTSLSMQGRAQYWTNFGDDWAQMAILGRHEDAIVIESRFFFEP